MEAKRTELESEENWLPGHHRCLVRLHFPFPYQFLILFLLHFPDLRPLNRCRPCLCLFPGAE